MTEDRTGRSLLVIDHVAIAVDDLDGAAARFRSDCGFGSFPGGVHPSGTKNWNIPLEPPQYLELVAVDDPTKPVGARVAEKLAAGEPLLGWAIEVDDLEAVARRVGVEPSGGQILLPDGTVGRWGMVVGEPGFPFFIRYGQERVERLQRWAQRYRDVAHTNPPSAISWLEIGGDEALLREWVGGELPLRYVGGPSGLRAVAIESAGGEIVLR